MNRLLSIFIFLIVFQYSGYCDTISSCTVYYKNELLRTFNIHSQNKVIEIDVQKVKPTDSITVIYYRDTPCGECESNLLVGDNNDDFIRTGWMGKGTLTPKKFPIIDLVNFGVKDFEVWYSEGDLNDLESDWDLLFRIKLMNSIESFTSKTQIEDFEKFISGKYTDTNELFKPFLSQEMCYDEECGEPKYCSYKKNKDSILVANHIFKSINTSELNYFLNSEVEINNNITRLSDCIMTLIFVSDSLQTVVYSSDKVELKKKILSLKPGAYFGIQTIKVSEDPIGCPELVFPKGVFWRINND